MVKVLRFRITKEFIEDTIALRKGERFDEMMNFSSRAEAYDWVFKINGAANRQKLPYKVVNIKFIETWDYTYPTAK